MPTGRRHLTRHDMKQDEFVSWVTRATIWVEQNSRTVLWGIGGALAVAAILIAGAAWWRSSREKAFVALGQVQRIARAPIVSEGTPPAGAYATAQERAARIVDAADRMLREYSRGTAADWARYHRASALLDLGRANEAAEAMQPLVDGTSAGTLLGDLARLLAGRTEEARGAYEKAADMYASAATGAGKAFPPELAIFDQARCLNALGKKQEAITAYQKIVEVYPESPLVEKANAKLQELRSGAQGL